MPNQKSDGLSSPSLHLDPGTTRRPGKSISGCKCILLTVALLIMSGIGLFLFFLFEQFLDDITQPHRLMYENVALNGVANRLSMVQPLISHEDTFDIAATVWVRKTETRGHGDVYAMERNGPLIEPLLKGLEWGDPVDQEIDLDNELEAPIFSEIVFRGLRLTDKHIFSTVNFSLPTAVFRATNLSNLDLRGSFVLIPSSPSLLDHIANYSSWVPDEIKPFPTRSWPFPLNSEQSEKSLADKAIESFGVTIPLLSFHGVHTRCAGDSSDAVPFEEDEEVTNQPPLDDNSNSPLLVTTNGKPLLKSHPYIVTRTQIQVVDQTKLFNRRAYMKAHRALQVTACGKTVFGHRPSRYLCEMKYKSHGHWMTQIQSGVKEPNGKVQTKWAYAPFMAATHVSSGPKDLLMIPVNRENCANAEGGDKTPSSQYPPEQDIINVSWKLAYSGRSPVKHMISAFSGQHISHNFNQSEYDKILEQDNAELWFGLVGHRFSENSHPRRRAFLIALGGVLSVFIILLDIRYWYTRRSTVGISILGNALIAGAEMFIHVASTIAQARLDQLSASAIARIEFGWWKDTTWIPVMQRAQATQKERASERLESRMTWSARAGLFMSLVALYSAISPHRNFVIPSILPVPAPGDFAPDRLAELSPYFIYPLHVTGKILQLTLNYHSKSFAGSYKITAALVLALNLSTLASFVPSLVGRYNSRPGLSIQEAVDLILLAITSWHAKTLPSIMHTEKEDHAE
ncbi:hypothetical protein BDZ94DRAFT_137676 [Collybia nuda]|uniref:Uncharacterized protein n=1 Tax=Collybia nuda TaxID=64659 RepID=A0A9P5YBA0_9AGAR|nr:hypothetical protein BDZ94DRAFT_137676 [Collybia nuda]